MLRQLSVDQFLLERDELPYGGRWAELVEGIPISSAARPRHGNVILNISKSLAECHPAPRISGTPALIWACCWLANRTRCVTRPSSYFLDGPRFAESDKPFTDATPAFVVELASPPTAAA